MLGQGSIETNKINEDQNLFFFKYNRAFDLKTLKNISFSKLNLII